MMPASYSAFNCYFDKRINVMMGIAQAVMVLGAIAYSPLMAFLMQHCGFRGTVAILAFLSLLNFPAMGVLQPAKWHMVRVPVEESVGGNDGMRFGIITICIVTAVITFRNTAWYEISKR